MAGLMLDSIHSSPAGKSMKETLVQLHVETRHSEL